MSGRGISGDTGRLSDFDPSTDWFTPVQGTAVGVLDRPDDGPQTDTFPAVGQEPFPAVGQEQSTATFPANDHPSFPPGTLNITPADVYEALGDEAEQWLAGVDCDVDELIQLINAETTVMPPLVLPEDYEQPAAEGEPLPQEAVEAVKTWKQRFLKGAIAAVIVSISGAGSAAAAMDKSVTVEVDGQEHTVNTYDSSVGEVLQDEGIQVGPHDALSPSPQSKISNGDTINLDRGRLLKLTVDGVQRDEWVRSGSVGQTLKHLGVNTEGAWTSAGQNEAIPADGMSLEVKTQKHVTLHDGAKSQRQITTTAVNVNEMLKQQQLNIGPQDSVVPGGDTKVTDGADVRINRTGTTVVNVTAPVQPPVQEIQDQNMMKGQEKVEEQGKAGEKIVTSRVTTSNGEETGRQTLGEQVTKPPKPKVVRVGAKQPPTSAVWDQIAKCEASGNWSMNSGNGYYGGLQFDKKTWTSNGGSQYAPRADMASKDEQIAVAEKVRSERGYQPWQCAGELGIS